MHRALDAQSRSAADPVIQRVKTSRSTHVDDIEWDRLSPDVPCWAVQSQSAKSAPAASAQNGSSGGGDGFWDKAVPGMQVRGPFCS